MKKKLPLLLLGLWSLAIPSYVRADMGAPEIKSYDILISNANGAKAIGDDKIIPYETKCTVDYESEYDGFLHLDVQCGGDEDTYTIDAKDARVLKDEYTPTNDDKLNKSIEYYIFKDIDLYRGPSFKYEKMGQTIPADTVVKADYFAGEDSIWSYVEYEGKKGWIYTYWHDNNNKIARVIQDEKDKNIITVKNITKLYKYPTDEKATVDVSIPAGTTLESKYHYQLLKEDGVYYVTYNGVSGWINAYDGLAINNKGSLLILQPDKVKVYDSNFKSTNLSIKKYQEFNFDYRYLAYINEKMQGIYRVKYKNKVYYLSMVVIDIDSNGSVDMYTAGVESLWYTIEVNKSVPVYESFDSKKIVGTAKFGEKFDRSYYVYVDAGENEDTKTYYYYFKNSSFAGWIEDEYVDDDDDAIFDDENNDEEDNSTTTKEVTTKKTNDMVDESKAMSTKDIVTMCIIGAVILALVVVVVIVLINRKKSYNKENTGNLSNNDNIITNNDNIGISNEENKEEMKETDSQ